MLDPSAAGSPVPPEGGTRAHRPPHLFVDADGVEWTVEWCDGETVSRRIPGGSRAGPGLLFSASGVIFHHPLSHRVYARHLTRSQLNAMVDRALE